MGVMSCVKCGRDLSNGLCVGCHNTPDKCSCDLPEKDEE
ncbi:hypothetical protein SAMN06269301_1565 [Geobacter sp. DSM 9736]|nr:hypothetical protein SAMN06269301_1565 [Geobacter sp. DSM 9736]